MSLRRVPRRGTEDCPSGLIGASAAENRENVILAVEHGTRLDPPR